MVEATAARNLAPAGGAVGFRALWEEFVLPIGRDMVPGTRDAVDRFAPDVLVVDQHALAGAAVALERGLLWATSATSSADLVDPLAGLPKVQRWLHDQMRDLLVGAGRRAPRPRPPSTPGSRRTSSLAFTSPELVGADRACPTTGRWWARPSPTGSTPRRSPGRGSPATTRSCWSPSAPSTGGPGGRFFAVAAEALGDMAVRAVVVAPADLVPDPPPNVLVVPRVPQVALLDHVDLVVGHGGHNTVCEALAVGVPLVLAPLRDDQPFVADQVVRAGAGERVKFGRITAPVLRAGRHRRPRPSPATGAAAARLRDSFAAAGGAAAAADRLDDLLVGATAGARPAAGR